MDWMRRESFAILLAEEGEMESVELEKMVKLVEQCLERVKSCVIRKHESPTPIISSTSPSASQKTVIPAINATNHPKMTGEPLFFYSGFSVRVSNVLNRDISLKKYILFIHYH